MTRERLAGDHSHRDRVFRWRGDGVSRIEGLSDAVFGFAVTLLVVSLDVPSTFGELSALILALPAFAITFTLLVLVWYAQYRFFRRYGLEDGRTMLLNVVLLFVVLFYIYPLKFVFQTIVALALAALASQLDVRWMWEATHGSVRAVRGGEWPVLMCMYAAGWVAMYGLFALMHRHALARRDALGLDALEVLATRFTIVEQSIMIGVGVLSVAVTLTLAYGVGIHPAFAAGAGGWTYLLIWPAQVLQARAFERRRRELAGAATPAAAPAAAPAE